MSHFHYRKQSCKCPHWFFLNVIDCIISQLTFHLKPITLPPCFILSTPLCKIDKIVFEALMMYRLCFSLLKAICCSNFVHSFLFVNVCSALRILFSNSSCSHIDLFSSFIDLLRLASSVGSALSY